jgi:2-polyprenyl-3-methyl-5-hydroxy-6-metoxy-1,4-benzoquinol methylase
MVFTLGGKDSKSNLERKGTQSAKTTRGSARSRASNEELNELGPWYHSFDSLGVQLVQLPGIYPINQKCKEGIILRYLQLCIEKSKKSCEDKPTVLEMFCADGYYAAHAKRMGAGRVTGIDWDQKRIKQAEAIYRTLFDEPGEFLVQDVCSFSPSEPYDIVLCCGGLYHVSEPRRVIENCFNKFSKEFLIVQSVVSLENNDEDYFVTPAPGWSHGSRFSMVFLRKTILQAGWQIVDSHFNELEGNERLCDRGSAYFLCQKPEISVSQGQQSSGTRGNVALCGDPNKFARRPRLEEKGEALVFHGYQEFELGQNMVRSLPEDVVLHRKCELLRPFFCPKYLAQREVIDLGASAGFFCFWALLAGAKKAIALDMDEQYTKMSSQARAKFGIENLHIVKGKVSEWAQPADVVLALAMIHWLYSCTETFGSLDAVIGNLSKLTRYMLIVEWVDLEDPAIDFFHHIDWNKEYTSGSYSLEAFQTALARHFARYTLIGEVSPTRRLYIALRTPHEIDLSGPLPLIMPKESVISSRFLAEYDGKVYWSRVYDGAGVCYKQATLDLAEREAQFLSKFDSDYFPRIRDIKSEKGYSVITLEKIDGLPLLKAKDDISSDPVKLTTFTNHCLSLLGELKCKGVIHRDIRPDNIIIRDGKPVLIDFGWAVSDMLPYFTPPELGNRERPPDGSFCDVYSMGKVLEQVNQHRYPAFDLVIALMMETDQTLRITDLEILKILFASVAAFIE